MALRKRKLANENNINLIPMIDITSFILLALAILNITMKKEASLDNILKLPPVLHAAKLDSTQLQIYILPAKILPGGYIDPDSTGLVAFAGKSNAPIKCPVCSLSFRTGKNEYIANTLLDLSRTPLATLSKELDKQAQEEADKAIANARPEAFVCSRCKSEISPYCKLDEIPELLRQKKKEAVDLIVLTENASRERNGRPLMTEEDIKRTEESLPLLIKADSKAFYARILQVVNMAKDTACDIRKFAFVTLAEASLEAQKKSDVPLSKAGVK